jgi:hypothetical protein
MHEPIFENTGNDFGVLIRLIKEREIQPEDRAMRWLTILMSAAIVTLTGAYVFAMTLT